VRSHSLDERRCQQLLALLDLWHSEGDSGSQELISFLTESSSVDVDVVVRSPLQIELILRSLNPSSAKPQVRALL